MLHVGGKKKEEASGLGSLVNDSATYGGDTKRDNRICCIVLDTFIFTHVKG